MAVQRRNRRDFAIQHMFGLPIFQCADNIEAILLQIGCILLAREHRDIILTQKMSTRRVKMIRMLQRFDSEFLAMRNQAMGDFTQNIGRVIRQ